jgi:hypothetical protein
LVWEGVAVSLAEDEPDTYDTRVVASAASVKRTVGVEVNASGWVSAVRFFKDAVCRWDSYTLGQRVVAVADVAHDRYLANQLDNPIGGQYPTQDAVAAAERSLNF